MDTVSDEQPARPLLRVVKGEPTPEQLAALVAVVGAAARAGATRTEPTAVAGGAWTDRAGTFRRPVPVGTGAWRASGWHPGARTRAGW